MSGIDWDALFALQTAPLELVIRGSAIYWFLFVIFRVFSRRDVGSIGIADILLLMLVADAAQNAMSGEYRSIPEGMILVATLVGWNVLLDFLTYRFAALGRLLQAPPLPLVVDGRVLRDNLRREFLSREELMAKLREKGVERLSQVKRACMESDGEVSVIRRDE